MGVIEIILLVIGSGGVSGFITWLVTVKSQKQKEQAIADQEGVKAKFDLHQFQESVFESVSGRLNSLIEDLKEDVSKKDKIIDTQGREINELKENQGNIIKANEMLMGRVEYLEQELNTHKSMVSDYKETCDKCQFRLENKSKKVK